MKNILQKKYFKISAIAILLVLTGAIYFQTQATNFSWIQSGWLGGQSGSTATHSTDANSTWTNFSAKDTSTNINGSGDAQMKKADNVTETTDADFSTNTSKDSSLAVSGNSIKLLKADGATCSVAGDCQSNICTGNVCVAPFICGSATVSYGGQTYNTVSIGTQCWLKENLNVGTMLASAATMPSNNSAIEKWCNSNSVSICNIEGGLYTWAEANGLAGSCNSASCAPTTPNQGICPTGWHIPTDTELMTLEEYLGMCSGTGTGCSGASGFRGVDQGSKMSTLVLNGDNSSGFTALLAGTRAPTNVFGNRGMAAHFWSSSEYSSSDGWWRVLFSSNSTVYRTSYNKAVGTSIRCIKN